MTRFGFIFAALQKIGQSLMVPVSVLPAAGLLVALGRILQGFESTLGKENILFIVGKVFYSGGLAIFEQLPLVFAIGVAIGLTGGAGVAGLAATVGYFTLKNVLVIMTETRGLDLAIDMGVLGGIIIGLLTARLYDRFHTTQLNPVLGFFSGKRLVPIVTAASSLILGLILGYIWPPIQYEIKKFGLWVVNSDLGPAFYAAGKRLLIPIGLHHVYYPSFLYEFGEFKTLAGQLVRGDSARYFAGDPSAGRFMAAEFPIMLFGLPAATLAMYLRAPLSRRAAIGGVMLSAALTSFITGITEPIEFAFIFVAPILFVFHVLAAFLSGWLTGLFDIHLGYTFSASAIDFVVGFFNQKNSMYLWFLVGPVIFALYFLVFYFLIGWLDLSTPGREKNGLNNGDSKEGPEEIGSTKSISSNSSRSYISGSSKDKAVQILSALGGSANLIDLDACITRLRVRVKDAEKVDISKLKQIGAVGVLNAGGGAIQAIFGTESDLLKDQIKSIIAEETVIVEEKKIEIKLDSPLKGNFLNLNQVPDEVFSQGILGQGLAIDPTDFVVTAPIDAEVVQVFRTGHAIGLMAEHGIEILIHIGIDTVHLGGKGFKTLIQGGQKVKKGDRLIEFDPAVVKAANKSLITPFVITNPDQFKSVTADLSKGCIKIII